MTLKFFCHIPKLHEFALHAACDDIVHHGAARIKSMPRPLYHNCIIEFAQKNSPALTVVELYGLMRQNTSNLCVNDCSHIPTLLVLLDHLDVSNAALDAHLRELIRILVDVKNDYFYRDDVIQAIRRFAVRCVSAGRHAFMVEVMSCGLQTTLPMR